MGRGSIKKDKYYCPKCGNKSLVRSAWNDNGTTRLSWTCKHAAVSKNEETALSWATEAPKRAQKYKDRRKELGEPCGCVIETPGRDAKIADHHTVLDLMIRDGELIKHFLLENYAHIRKRGLEVLYSGKNMDLVKLTDQRGPAVWIYWRCTTDPDRDRDEIPWFHFRQASSRTITYRNVSTSDIFSGDRFAVWAKDKRKSNCRTSPFYEDFKKADREAVIDWAKGLDAEFEFFCEKARTKYKVWSGKHTELSKEFANSKIGVDAYNGDIDRVRIRMLDWITPEQARAIKNIINPQEVPA